MEKTNKYRVIAFVGKSGAGKDYCAHRFVDENPENTHFIISSTTRPKRDYEIEGVNYHFLSREEFERRIAAGEMLEYTEYCGNYYGTPKKEAEEVLASGRNLLLEIEVEGAANVKKAYPEAVLIMLLPPSFAVQEARLRGRGTETEEKIRERLSRTREEVPCVGMYDYVIYNHDGRADEAVADIRAIVRAETRAIARNSDAATKYFE